MKLSVTIVLIFRNSSPQMWSIQEALNTSQRTVQKPFKATVVARKLEGEKVVVGVADPNTATKLFASSKEQAEKIRDGYTYIFRTYTSGRYSIFLRENTIITRCPNQKITQTVLEQARSLVDPKPAPIHTTQEIKAMQPRTPAGVTGVIEQVNLYFMCLYSIIYYIILFIIDSFYDMYLNTTLVTISN